MIEYIKGELASLSPTTAVIDCGGVGYELGITLLDYERLQGLERAKLYVHEAIREDAHMLYGFSELSERALFRLLIGVSGVGPAAGRLILSTYNDDKLQTIISTGDTAALKAVKGIGAKTAERIIIDLRDKINRAEGTLLQSAAGAGRAAFEDALAALTTLGFPAPAARKALDKVFKHNPSAGTEEAIRMAIKSM